MSVNEIAFEIDPGKARQWSRTKLPFMREAKWVTVTLSVASLSLALLATSTFIAIVAGVCAFAFGVVAISVWFVACDESTVDFDDYEVKLDRDGFSYAFGDKRRHYRWSEVSEFNVVSAFGEGIGQTIVVRSAAQPGTEAPMTPGRYSMAIFDIYSASLLQIAATLNEYRDNALLDQTA